MKYSIRTSARQTKVWLTGATAALAAVTFSVVIALGGSAASAITGGTLFGSASQQADGVHLISDSTHPYSGINFIVPAGTTVNSLTGLEATLKALTGACGGGSPRFSVKTAAGNIFVYIGTAPSFNACSDGSTGNLLATADSRVDTSQVAGGTFYDTWAHTVSLAGSSPVTGLALVVDGGWLAPQEFLLTSAGVNGITFNYLPSKDSCKTNGWRDFTSNPGPFKNQGECVSWFNHHNGVGQDDAHVATH